MSFLNPLFLFGLSALAIPIVVHLVRRERAERLAFSSLMFLRPVAQKTLRHLRLRHILLLALRMLAIALLALAFARPFLLRELHVTGSDHRAKNVVILIDNSFSMGYQGRLQKAKQKAYELIDGLASGDLATVASFSRRFEALGQPSSNKASLKAMVEDIKLTPEGTDYLSAIRAADSMFDPDSEGEKIVYLISDFQRTGFNREESFRLSPGVELKPIDVGVAEASNLAISHIDITEEGAGDSAKAEIKVKVTNFGPRRRDATVTLSLNGRELASRAVIVDANSSQGIAFTDVPVFPGSNRGKLELSGDDLSIDNQFHFTFSGESRLRILAADNLRRASKRKGTFFLEKALSTGRAPRFQLVVKDPTEISPQDLAACDLLILNNVDRLQEDALAALSSFVREGAGVIFFVGDDVDPKSFNRSFSDIAPAKLSTRRSGAGEEQGPFLLTYIKSDHPIFSPFAAARSGNFAASLFFSIFSVEARPGSSVIARFDDGSPALLETRVGKGVSLLYASTSDDGWNSLPLNPVYLPFVHQMVKYASGYRPRRDFYLVGQTLPIDLILPEASTDENLSANLSVTGPQGYQARAQDRSISLPYPGVYEIKWQRPHAAARLGQMITYVAANTDINESDLRRFDPQELVAAVSNPSKQSKTIDSKGWTDGRELENRQLLWRYFLAAALLFLMAETIIANKFYGK